ncbi:MAG: helix-turn-helix domain-containing protein [Gemmatimonadaceae bacterium]
MTNTAIAAKLRTRLVVALVLGRVARARFEQAVGRSDRLEFVSTLADLRARVLGATVLVTIVAEARDETGGPTAPLLREIVVLRPATAIIGYCHAGSASADILDLACAGIDELVQEGIDDEGIALRTAFSGSIEACAARTVRAAIEHLIPGALRPLVDFCLQYPQEDHSVEGLGRALGVDRKTLLNHSHRLELPPPSTLAMWCRLLLAAAILERTGQPVEQVALTLEFASPSAFRNACRRYARERPSSWREAGGLARVVRKFEAACDRFRLR